MQTVYEISESLGLKPRTVMEIGACHPEQLRVWPFINRGDQVILIEANPRLAYCLTHGYNDGDFKDTWPQVPPPPHQSAGLDGYKNVSILNVAIVDHPAPVVLHEFNVSSFVSGVAAPAVVNDAFVASEHSSYVVDGVTIDQVDDGTIDILLVDVEGSEWSCLKHLLSRPKIIVVEFYGGNYLNPHYDEIKEWMRVNGYNYTDRDQSDALYIRN
jgi:hypothetical protein